MTIQRNHLGEEGDLAAKTETRPDYPADPARPAKGPLARQRAADRRQQIEQRDAAVSNQLWESLAQRMAGLSYLAEAMAKRLMLDNPAESQQARRIAELASGAVREACQLASTLAPHARKRSLK